MGPATVVVDLTTISAGMGINVVAVTVLSISSQTGEGECEQGSPGNHQGLQFSIHVSPLFFYRFLVLVFATSVSGLLLGI